MATPQDIAAAIAGFVQNVSGLRTVTDPESIANPPVAAVLPVQGTFIDYTVALELGVANYMWRIVVMVSEASGRAGMAQLYGYLAVEGATSIAAAILADPTLGHTVDFCVPVEATSPHDIAWGPMNYLGAEIIVQAGAQ